MDKIAHISTCVNIVATVLLGLFAVQLFDYKDILAYIIAVIVAMIAGYWKEKKKDTVFSWMDMGANIVGAVYGCIVVYSIIEISI